MNPKKVEQSNMPLLRFPPTPQWVPIICAVMTFATQEKKKAPKSTTDLKTWSEFYNWLTKVCLPQDPKEKIDCVLRFIRWFLLHHLFAATCPFATLSFFFFVRPTRPDDPKSCKSLFKKLCNTYGNFQAWTAHHKRTHVCFSGISVFKMAIFSWIQA
jgi:hypothetical protein